MNLSATPERPLASIILLCYNHEKFIAEALDGLFAQTYSPLEIVIIDDCSLDRTAEVVAAKLAQRSNVSNVEFLRNPKNMTGEAGCQIGLNMTRGAFVHIASGDDIMFPEMIAEMVEVWTEEKVSLVTTNARYVDEKSNSLDRTYRDPDIRADDSFETLARDGANACCFAPTMGFERELYSAFGWPPSLFLGGYDIMYPFYAYLLKGARFIEKPLLKYRVHAENTSLSLIAEKSDGMGKLITSERILNGHLAHAVLMQDELARLGEQMPDRYHALANKISPLLTIQTVEMARKLVRTRIQLENLRRGL
jgi:glycosyltransferase involved in cell wall biosynthesis